MLVILSSSKTQAVSPVHGVPCSQPPLLEEAELLAQRCQQLSCTDIAGMMKISEKLAQTTHSRFQLFRTPHTPGPAGAALTSFQGDVFAQLKTENYLPEDYLFAQKSLCILSGLYGILRPLDLMQPYRLEMGYKIKTSRGTSLYEFWGGRITDFLNETLREHKEQTLINCASQEYSRAIIKSRLAARVLNIIFRQNRNGVLKTIAIHAKRARGMFADWYVRNRISTSADLAAFNRAGYRFQPEQSSAEEYVFITDLS